MNMYFTKSSLFFIRTRCPASTGAFEFTTFGKDVGSGMTLGRAGSRTEMSDSSTAFAWSLHQHSSSTKGAKFSQLVKRYDFTTSSKNTLTGTSSNSESTNLQRATREQKM